MTIESLTLNHVQSSCTVGALYETNQGENFTKEPMAELNFGLQGSIMMKTLLDDS